MSIAAYETPAPHLHHAVQFYEDEDFLVGRIADFLAEGMRAGEPCIVIATAEHNRSVAERLLESGLDADAVHFLDARSTMERFLDRGVPDARKFQRVVGGTIRKLAAGGSKVRAYGEMVDLLWRDGEPDAALHLEDLWNRLGQRQSFSLLCAYPMGNFYKESDPARFETICRQHSLVHPTEQLADADGDERDRRIALLEQRAAALQAEILHRKELEARLSEALAERRRSDERLKDFVNNATTALHWVQADGTIEWANPAELTLLGYTAEEYIGHNIREFHADSGAIHDILCRLGANEEIHDYEAPLRAKDGSIKWVSISSNVLFEDGKFVHTRCFTRDITERKRLQEENAFLLTATRTLMQSLDYDERLRKLAELVVPRLADWCVVIIARDGSYERVVVTHADPANKPHADWLRQLGPGPADRDPVLAVLRSGEPRIIPEMTEDDLRAIAGNDEDIEKLRSLGFRSRMIVPMSVRGRVVGALTFVAAESGRRYGEADLALALDLATRAAGALEIARLYHFAESNNRAKDEFLATLSHELRTPLTSIIGWARMLSMGGLDPATLRTAVTTIEQSARMQAALVDDLLDVSRIVTGKLSLEAQPVDLSTVVRDGVSGMRVAADSKGIRLGVSGLDERTVVNGDATRLQQIVWNLVTNAVKFSESGSEVEVRVERDETSARLVVRDRGHGIAPSFLPHVFEPFRQADGSMTRSQGGLGLGLAIVKYLVEAHGGSVRADSAGLGLGATFTVTLPLARRAVNAAEDAGPLADLAGQTVLLVDDDVAGTTMLKTALEHCGATVHVVRSVAAARRSLSERLPHIVVTDVVMPGEDGFALLRHVRETVAPRIPVLALTAMRNLDPAQGEFDAFLRKPADPLEIARAISRSLQRPAR